MTDNTVHARVAGSQFGMHQRGEVIEVDESTLSKHPNTLEKVDQAVTEAPATDEDDSEDAGEEDGLTVDDLDPHPADLKVSELEERIEDVTDVEMLETILEAEKAAEDRTTAKDAVKARLNELEG